MSVTIKDVIQMARELPEESLAEAYKNLKELRERANSGDDSGESTEPIACVSCGSVNVSKNGKRYGKQSYLCKDCGRSFFETSGSALSWSHMSPVVWKQVISDTVNGVSIDNTAEDLDLSHDCVFHMRHKILKRLEDEFLSAQTSMDGTYDADETYVLESVKGRKIPAGYHRKARKHGAKASKAGISNEYICVCTSINDDKDCMAVSVNRAAPGKEEIELVFGEKVCSDTLLLCDGNTNYDVLEEKCTVAHTKRVNKANGFHSFIKGRLLEYRGVATTYLNRYNALFASIFGRGDNVIDEIFVLMKSRDDSFRTIANIESQNLLRV